MAHPLDHEELGAGHQLGRSATARHLDERIRVAVDDERRDAELRQPADPVTGAPDGIHLTTDSRRVVRALDERALTPSLPEFVELVGAPDRLRECSCAVHCFVEVGGRRTQLHELCDQLRRGLPDRRLTGRRHDRGEGRHAFGVLDREDLGDHRAHRTSPDVGAFDRERVEQADGVGGHVGQRVARPLGEVRAEPDVAVVEADHLEVAIDERLAELVVVSDALRAQSVDHEQHRVVGVAEAVVVDVDPVRGDGGHPVIVPREIHPVLTRARARSHVRPLE